MMRMGDDGDDGDGWEDGKMLGLGSGGALTLKCCDTRGREEPRVGSIHSDHITLHESSWPVPIGMG